MNEIQAQLDRIEAMLITILQPPAPQKLSPSAELAIVAARGQSPAEYLKNKYRNETIGKKQPRRQKP